MVQSLLSNQEIWRARDLPAGPRTRTGLSTGFPVLDRLLYHGGWPRVALTEILCDSHGIGEMRLLTPALSRLCEEETRWLAWINPPFTPYAPALVSWGIAIERLLVVCPNSDREALWSLEQTLQSGACSAVLAWIDERHLKTTQMRRILARTKQGNTWTILFRPLCASQNPSPAELRMAIEPLSSTTRGEVKLSILKRRAGWACESLLIQPEGHPALHSRETVKLLWERWRREFLPVARSGKTP